MFDNIKCYFGWFIVAILMIINWWSGSPEEYSGGYNDGPNNDRNQKDIADMITSRAKPEFKAEYKRLLNDAMMQSNAKPVVTLDDIHHTLSYTPGLNLYKSQIHVGQRKLFLTELQFLTDHAEPGVPIVCVYAGAAPSIHTGYLAKLFPDVKFLLVDPNPFRVNEAKPVFLNPKDSSDNLIQEVIKGKEQIYIINDLFTNEIATSIGKYMKKSLFVSDIRTNVYNEAQSPGCIDIVWNSSMMYNWIKLMNPSMSMLKFRHPFYLEGLTNTRNEDADFAMSKKYGIDFVKNFKNKEFIYFDGDINIQAFAPVNSTETRLITDGKKLKNWGTHNEYEDKLFYFNSICRTFVLYDNPNDDYDLGFDHCADCALENVLWSRYIKKYPHSDVKAMVKKLSDVIHRPLKQDGHGTFFHRRNAQKLISQIQKYNK